MYNQSHSQIGQVRMAGSLETSNRRVNRNHLIEIERESTSLYDELFPESRARTPGTRAPRKEEPKKNKNPISPITKKVLDDDSYKSDPEPNESDSDIEPSPRRRKSKSEKNIVISPRNRQQRFIDSESDDQDKNYLDDDDDDDDIDVIRKPVKFVTPTPRKIPPTVRRPPVVHSADRRFRNDDDDDEDDDNNKETFTKVDARPNQKRAPVTVNQYRSESNLSSNNNTPAPARNFESEVRPRTGLPTENLQDLVPPNDYSHNFFDGMDDLEFLYRLAPRGTLICCTIRIRPNVIASDEYELILKDCPGKNYPLLTTSAKAVATGVFYWLKARHNQKNGGDKSRNIEIGKLESNFGKKKFTLTTPTLSNFTKEYDYDYNEKYNVHEHFGLVYGNRLIADAKPKEIRITLKAPKTNASEHLGTDSNEFETHILESKRPILNQTTRNYQLDFRGRANLPSTSNVQIIEPTNPEEILLQLGRMEKHEYSLDFSYPFCILSAFGFALACLSRG